MLTWDLTKDRERKVKFTLCVMISLLPSVKPHHREDEKKGCLRSKSNNSVEVRDKSCWNHMIEFVNYPR